MVGGLIISDPDGNPIHSEKYNSETLTVPASQTNWDVRLEASKLFTVVTRVAHRIHINTNVAINVKFNSTSNDSIPIEANKFFDDDSLLVRDIYITTTSAATVYILMRGAGKP